MNTDRAHIVYFINMKINKIIKLNNVQKNMKKNIINK